MVCDEEGRRPAVGAPGGQEREPRPGVRKAPPERGLRRLTGLATGARAGSAPESYFTSTKSPEELLAPVVVLPLYCQRHVPSWEAVTVVFRWPVLLAVTDLTVV